MPAGDAPGAGQRRRRGPGGGRGQRRNGCADARDVITPPIGLSEQKRAFIETALLIALMEEGGHGYGLIERVRALVGDQLLVDPGSVYRILRSLEEAGVVSSSWEEGEAGPQRRAYTIEPAGRELLSSWAEVLAARGRALLSLSRLASEKLGPA